jgi:hypothetical protein
MAGARRGRRRLVTGAIAVAVVGLTFAFVLSRIAGYRAVWQVTVVPTLVLGLISAATWQRFAPLPRVRPPREAVEEAFGRAVD